MTHGIIIRDGTQPGGSGSLDFGLAELLGAIGEPASCAMWKCSRLHYVSRDEIDIDVLERASTLNGSVKGIDLINGIHQMTQVIDGEFEATDETGRPWALIRAVDSSWWEVWSDDESVLDAVRGRFKFTETTSQHAR